MRLVARALAVFAAALLPNAASGQVVLLSDASQHWYALIDTAGNRVGDRVFESFRSYRNGMAAVGISSWRMTWLNLQGEALPATYREVSDFDANGFAIAREDEKAVVVDKTGAVVRELKPKVWAVMRHALFGYTGERRKKVGLVNSQGVEILKPKYYLINEFHEGLAAVFGERYDSPMGYIDTTGALVIPQTLLNARSNGEYLEVIWQQRGNFRNGRAAVALRSDGPWKEGFINRKGELVIPYQWRETRDFYDGYAAVQAMGDSTAPWGYIDTTGAYLVEPILKHAADFRNGAARATLKNGDVIVIDTQGNNMRIGNPVGDRGDNGYMAVRSNEGRVGYINAKKEWGIAPSKLGMWHQVGYAFSQGLAPVELAPKKSGPAIAHVWFEIKQGGTLGGAGRQFYVDYAIVEAQKGSTVADVEDMVTNKPRRTLAVSIAKGIYELPMGQREPELGDIMDKSVVKPRYTKDGAGRITWIDSVDPRYLGRFK